MKFELLSWLGAQMPLSSNGPSEISRVDVVVVGAGLSGLSAAKHLLAANLSVTVLEARDRVGGRVANHYFENGGVTELGAAFVGPTQDHVLELIDELGLKTFLQHDDGNVISYSDGNRILFDNKNGEISGFGKQTDEKLIHAFEELNQKASTINTTVPWSHPDAVHWDAMTFGAWLDTYLTPSSPARNWFESVVAAIWSAKSTEMSLLYVLTYIASAGNAAHPGTIDRLLATTDGAQERRILGGSGLIPTQLAHSLGPDRILLSSPVHTISHDPHSGLYLVRTDHGLELRAPHVVIAMSPPLASRIRFEPPLPAARDQLMQRMFMGSIGKTTAIYPRPFWREAGLRGQVTSDTGTVRVTFDVSPANASYGAMLGFLEVEEARYADGMSETELVGKVTEDYVRYFGEEARNVSEWAVMRWDQEVFSRGGPVAVAGTGTLSGFGNALREPIGGIHWAGTETARAWIGYMDGAVEAGERVAEEILRARLV